MHQTNRNERDNVTTFKRNCWNPADFLYAYSPKCRAYPRFLQENDCIVNSSNPETHEFDYVSMVTKRQYQTGAVLSTHCSFEHYGAPLIVITSELTPCPDGITRYGHHIEVVAYEGGINIWYLIPKADTVEPVNLIRKKFPVADTRPALLRVKVAKKSLAISLDETAFEIAFDHIPETFHAGITACEGINRFYDFAVTE